MVSALCLMGSAAKEIFWDKNSNAQWVTAGNDFDMMFMALYMLMFMVIIITVIKYTNFYVNNIHLNI